MTIKRQQGSFMLEFLISLAIFSIALVGLVKLQNRSISDLGDLGADMAIPILIADFSDRVNLSANGKLTSQDETELKQTAGSLMKELSFSGGNKIVIKDMYDSSKTFEYEVELDGSRI